MPLKNPRTIAAREEERSPERLERRSQVRGLLLLALAAIVFAIVRAGIHSVFAPGWWRF